MEYVWRIKNSPHLNPKNRQLKLYDAPYSIYKLFLALLLDVAVA
jgi:hypothetical protein